MRRSVKIFQNNNNLAQSITELTIFGGIAIFIIASIFKTGFGKSLIVNERLRVFRMALTESYRNGQRQHTGGLENRESAARNTATLVVIEDRLSVDAGSKFGTRERIPMASSASATFTRNMFLPYDPDTETWSTPVVDYIINGQRFPLLVGGVDSFEYRGGVHPNPNIPTCDGDSAFLSSESGGPICWAKWCMRFIRDDSPPPPAEPQWGLAGCPVIYRMANKTDPEFCHGEPPLPPPDQRCKKNMTADERFDLNLDGELIAEDGDVLSGVQLPDGTLQREVYWQWIRVPLVPSNKMYDVVLGADETRSGTDCLGAAFPGPWDTLTNEEIRDLPSNCLKYKTIVVGSDTLTRADARGDMKGEDKIERYDVTSPSGPDPDWHPIVAKIWIDDPFGGHISFADRDNPSGLKLEESQMFTFTDPGDDLAPDEGTYYLIEEGQLLDADTGQYIRTTTRQDSVDVIQRKFVLLNNLERFCVNNGGNNWSPRVWAAPWTGGSNNYDIDHALGGMTNPVEVCVYADDFPWDPGEDIITHPCFESSIDPKILYKTCMQVGVRGGGGYTLLPEIYVRSRMRDLRGKRWITKTSD